MINLEANVGNANNMYRLMEELFPIHRSLVGPGFSKSLKVVKKQINLDVLKFKSGTKFYDWEIPKGFKVNDVYIKDSKGKKYLNFQDNHYHVWSHSSNFFGQLTKKELLKKVNIHHSIDDAIPLKPTYYRKKWGLCASKNEVKKLPNDLFEVNIDVENIDYNLEIGIARLKGKSKKKVLISSYLCHPHGANDNLSGVVILTELYNLLKKKKNLEFIYIFAIWPETLGAIVFINKFKKQLKNFVGGFSCMILGDSAPFLYKKSIQGNSLIDRAFLHALKNSGMKHKVMDYFSEGSCERQFNSPGVRLPYGLISRGFTRFKEYHTSLDNLNLVKKKNLLESLKICCKFIETLERNFIYIPKFKCEPFLSKYGIYPYDLGAGEGKLGTREAFTYYDISNFIDTETDLLSIAERLNIPINLFDRAISDFLKVGLLKRK